MKTSFAKPGTAAPGAVAVGIYHGLQQSGAARRLDRQSGGALSRALAASRFRGQIGDILTVAPPRAIKARSLILVGLGKMAALDGLAAERAAGALAAHVLATGETDLAIEVDAPEGSTVDGARLAAHVANGVRLRSYRFDRYRTTEKPDRKPRLARLAVHSADPAGGRRAYAPLASTTDSALFIRDLVSEPGNVVYPASFAARARELKSLGLKIDVLGRDGLKKLGMNAMLGVAQGSINEPQLVVLEWQGAGKGGGAPIAFVGKGVTFDTGGISIKPAGGMEEMKYDMAGAGAVLGVMRSLAARGAKANAVGICAMVENMPGENAQRPGDVVRTMSGRTIEVIDTDAEGRLVLSDALYFAHARFKPRAIIDLATLTGSIVVALGHEHGGLFGNDGKLADQLLAAGIATGEKLWPMPLTDDYRDLIKSDIADWKNDGGRWCDAINAAMLLKQFVGGTPWAHLDIAAMAWTKEDRPTIPKGATGYGVRLLDRLVADCFESK
ncbi:MAG TPA: leucyl aminopeptidase [Dongiaceae bacterium]|jgi:leucyl aminopeptidase